MDEKWDRREEDRKSKDSLARSIDRLEERLESRLAMLAERVNEIDEFLRGGTGDQDPLGTRVHLVETAVAELRALVKGDAMGRGSLIEITRQASTDASEARKVAEGKTAANLTKRGQNVLLWAAGLSLLGTLTMASLTNWEKIHRSMRPETPEQKLERLEREIAEEMKTRGPEVKKRLREIERAARQR